MKLLSMADVVRRLGIPRHRITYALERQFLKEPHDPFPVSVPVFMRELGNSPRGVSEGGARPRP